VKRNAALARKVALSCRILAKLGLFKETTGHVSARNSRNQMLIRGRGPKETGLLFTKPSDILLADLEGQNLEKRAGLKPPNEAVIHGEIYKARPEVVCVVHAHPPAVVLCSMAGIELRPIYCGYDPSSMRLSLRDSRLPAHPYSQYQGSSTRNAEDHGRKRCLHPPGPRLDHRRNQRRAGNYHGNKT
jgi:Class II Aldolase and Adducin N-terminal domain